MPEVGNVVELSGSIAAIGRVASIIPGGAVTIEWTEDGRRRSLAMGEGTLKPVRPQGWVARLSWPVMKSPCLRTIPPHDA
jgi:hypothetical protein